MASDCPCRRTRVLLYIIERMERGERLSDMPRHVRHVWANAAAILAETDMATFAADIEAARENE